MKLYIKYMVSLRCKLLVREELKKLGIRYALVELGVIELPEDLDTETLEQLRINLLRSGLEIMDNKRSILVERIKNVITQVVQSEELLQLNFSDYLSEKLAYDYTYLANTFSEVKGTTIQQYLILHKIERVKELLLYDELNLTEISFQLHYSSVGHLSRQFKKITGLTPTFYKQLKEKRRTNLEDL
ncbi:MAG TPA: AraC family transcriptional regulator [Cryomorphaceae bacterium]|mgnify:CR=1 FL=1|nr:AraC family transcriptional regulator [Owenweeksia sp.]HBF21939.1 AraC family transcriptional regulator [Cryomorphaceae bacterium]